MPLKVFTTPHRINNVPYTRFVKKGNKVDVYKKEAGKEVKAFTSHGSSLAEAHRKAGIREAASKGRLRVKARSKKAIGN